MSEILFIELIHKSNLIAIGLFVLNDYSNTTHVCGSFYDCVYFHMTGPVESEKHAWQRKHWKLVLKNRYYLKNCNICVLLLHSVWSVVEVILILYSEIKCVYQGWLLKAEWDSSSCWQLYLGPFITGNNSSLSFCCCSLSHG